MANAHTAAHAHGQYGPHGESNHALNAMDPHGEGHHKHVIVSVPILLGVLMALLGLTALTMGASYAEKWVAEAWNVEIPHIVNVLIALSIATVKSLLVVLFFMQLKYDNKINAVTLGFCLFTVALFLGLTMMDLGSRASIYDYKSGEIQQGGQGISTKRDITDASGQVIGTVGVDTGGKPIVQYWREAYIERYGIEKFKELEEKAHKKYGKHTDHGPVVSTPNHQVIRAGATPGLFGAEVPEGAELPPERRVNR